MDEAQRAYVSFCVWVDENTIDFEVFWLKVVLHDVFGFVTFVRVNTNCLASQRISLICLELPFNEEYVSLIANYLHPLLFR